LIFLSAPDPLDREVIDAGVQGRANSLGRPRAAVTLTRSVGQRRRYEGEIRESLATRRAAAVLDDVVVDVCASASAGSSIAPMKP
jgi:hypothetical protein